MSADSLALCSHCLLPVGLRAMRRTLNGESCTFCCYGCSIAYQVKQGRGEESEAAWLLIRLGVGGFLSMNIMLFSVLDYTGAFTGADANVQPAVHLLQWLFATPAVLILGGPFMRETFIEAVQGRLASSALIVVGTLAAYAYSTLAVIQGASHVYFDTASMVLMLFTVGRYLEAAGRAKAARDLAPLLAAESEMATVVEGEVEQRRPVREVVSGVLVRVRPGERIPVDGTIVEGCSHADEAVMTGESRPIEKSPGCAVIAGSINLEGPLLVRSMGAGNATRWAQICRSVREALIRRSPSQRLADRIVGAFVPLVLLLGVGTAAVWSQSLPFDQALQIGLSVLVVACPCAVGLAAPLASSLGIGLLARHGCLVRDPAALEALARTHQVAFDKTGTLTSGQARIVAIESTGVDENEVLARAAGLERHSEHGLGRAVLREAVARGLVPAAAQSVRVMFGRGIIGKANGEAIAAGNDELMHDLGWKLAPELATRGKAYEASGYSRIYVGWDGGVRAVLALDDTPLPEARAAIGALRQRGLHAILLTGDLLSAARRIASAVGIDEIEAGLSPEQKRATVNRLRRKSFVAMVGDGLNDGPVLASADVGIAVGSATDLARETAAVVLPPGGLWLLPYVIDVARAVRKTILGNLAWAFGYNFVVVALAVAGMLQPVLAAAVMAGSSLLVVLNSLRLERLSNPSIEGLHEFGKNVEVEGPGEIDVREAHQILV
jgi:Cu2+-exporting ATPase